MLSGSLSVTIKSVIMSKILLVCAFFILTLSSPGGGVSAVEPTLEAPDIATKEKDMLFLLVDKDSLRADLKTWPQDPKDSEVLMSFRIAIGKEEGDKQVEGDNRTPEGIYFAQNLIDGRTLPAKYGPYAIPIDFPNPIDRALGKTGHGIWLHGVEEDKRIEEANVTEGCVAFYNADIDSLTHWLKPFQSVIVIAQSADEEVNQAKDLKAVRNATEKWYQAWQERNLEEYLAFYGERFRMRGMNAAAFAEYKGRVFRQYKEMTVEISDLRVFTHNQYAVAVFNQDFNGDDHYISKGRKMLYWMRGDDESWSITNEIFESKRFEMQSFSRDLLVRISKESPSADQFVNEAFKSNL